MSPPAGLGVFRGNSGTVLAHYARQYGRPVFLFDTFEGIDRRDLAGIDQNKTQDFAATSLPVARHIVGCSSVVFMQGWFPDSVTSDIEARRYAVVHLDCDLYEPVLAGPKFFYPRLSPCGLLIIQD